MYPVLLVFSFAHCQISCIYTECCNQPFKKVSLKDMETSAFFVFQYLRHSYRFMPDNEKPLLIFNTAYLYAWVCNTAAFPLWNLSFCSWQPELINFACFPQVFFLSSSLVICLQIPFLSVCKVIYLVCFTRTWLIDCFLPRLLRSCSFSEEGSTRTSSCPIPQFARVKIKQRWNPHY